MLGPEYLRTIAKIGGYDPKDPKWLNADFIYKAEKPPMPEDPMVKKAKLLADSSLGYDSSPTAKWITALQDTGVLSEEGERIANGKQETPPSVLDLKEEDLKIGPRASARIGIDLANRYLFDRKRDYQNDAWRDVARRINDPSIFITDMEEKITSENALNAGATNQPVATGQSILKAAEDRVKTYNDSLKDPVQLDREYMNSLVAKMSQSDAVKRDQTLQGMNPNFRAFAIAFGVGRMVSGGNFWDGIDSFSAAMQVDQGNIDQEYQAEQARINSEKENAKIQYQAAINMNKTDNEVVESWNKNQTNAFEADMKFFQNQLNTVQRAEDKAADRDLRWRIFAQKDQTTRRGQAAKDMQAFGELYISMGAGNSPAMARAINEAAKRWGIDLQLPEEERPFTPKEKLDIERANNIARKTLELVESFELRKEKLTSEIGLNNKRAEFWATRTQFYPQELQLKLDEHLRKINEGFYKNEFDYDKLNQSTAEADAKGKLDVIVKARDNALISYQTAQSDYNDLLNKIRTADPDKEGRVRNENEFTAPEKDQLAYAASKVASAKFEYTRQQAIVEANPYDKLLNEAKAIWKQESEAQRDYQEQTRDGKKFIVTPQNIGYQLNVPYGYGEESSKAADCSGLVCKAFNDAGLDIGRPTANSLSTHPQFGSVYNTFRKTDVAKQQTNFKNIIAGLQPNDLILIDWDGTGKKFDHVVVFVGNNAIVHAPRTGTVSQKVEASKYLEGMKGNPTIKVVRHKKLGGARVAT